MGLLIKLSVQFVSKACFLGEIQRSSTIVRLTLRKLQVLHPYRNIFRQTALLNDCMNHCINHCDQPLYRWHTVTVVFLQSFSWYTYRPRDCMRLCNFDGAEKIVTSFRNRCNTRSTAIKKIPIQHSYKKKRDAEQHHSPMHTSWPLLPTLSCCVSS